MTTASDFDSHNRSVSAVRVLALNAAVTANADKKMHFLYDPAASQDAFLLGDREVPPWRWDLWGGKTGYKSWQRRLVDTIQLPALVRDTLRYSHVPFLKMDCEGCEFEALPADPDFFIHRVTAGAWELHGVKYGCEFNARSRSPRAGYKAACNATVEVLKQRRCPDLFTKRLSLSLTSKAEKLGAQFTC